MPRHRHRSANQSQFPVSAPAPAGVSVPSPFSLREEPKKPFDMEDVFRLVDEGEFEAALEMLDSAPKWMQREPEFKLVRITALMQAGEMEAAGEMLREMERKTPKLIALYLPLAIWYMLHEWPAHALKAARKVQAADFDKEASEQVQDIIENANEMLAFLAAELNLPREKAEQASWFNEQAQLASLDQSISEAERMTKEALKIAPYWTSPRNNYAKSLYELGKFPEALAQSESVLAADPNNVHALNNLTIFHTGLGLPELAATYAARLFELAANFKDDWDEMDIVISALALVEDTERLWQLAQRYRRKPSQMLLERSWHILGVAGIRAGQFKEARKFLETAGQDGNLLATNLLEKLDQALREKKTRLTWPPLYPGFEFLLSERLLREWTDVAGKVDNDRPTPAQQRKIDAFLTKHPSLLAALKKMLWEEEISEAGAHGLVILNKPEADAELLRFASSDLGDMQSRMNAGLLLAKVGRHDVEKTFRFWDESRGEWVDVQLISQEIGDVDYNIKPAVEELIEKAGRASNPQESIAILRRAVQLDPNCAMALHNLGAYLSYQGEPEEGERLMRRSIEVDPTYTFGFANLGLIEAQRGETEAALDLLQNVNKAKVITPKTAAVYNLAHAVLAINEQDFERAERHLESAREMDPDDPSIKKIEEMLRLKRLLGDTSFFAKYQKESANRFHKKALNTPLTAEMGLKTCLENLTVETMVAMCRFWNAHSSGKKKELVERLAGSILDLDVFTEITEKLNDQEREALKSILEAGGWRPWQDFVAQFGDDFDESPWWKYHDPESVPGRLKLASLLYAGTLEGQQVAYIPADVRPLVKKLMN